ncbi:peptidase M23 [Dyadobacter luteus]|uniref:Peptidase M23 n=1 Tax=Dyadobacter luteus TaxID=2259619 RepID=A0A3D8Y8Z9_9BACT|nr:peptidoglycan DD-metalloendopeptidase family protein [Dyadobacter luteus]REA59310.1 peptidase M23 [Dyadobacter luteus]
MNILPDLLRQQPGFANVINTGKPFRKLDFSAANTPLLKQDLTDTDSFSKYIFDEMLSQGTYTGVGGYNENRVIYLQRAHFMKEEQNPRNIHLGVDIWERAGEPVYTPLDAALHSFAFNNHLGDYGPTIILTHQLNGIEFFTLYGHLSESSLLGLYVGKEFRKGEKIGEIGNYPHNGDWPPHLHFQIIADMGNREGDFPGVCSIGDRLHFLTTCPDPNLILRIDELK